MTVALVLGAAVREDGSASPTLRARVEHAVELFHAGDVDALCISGGVGRFAPSEAEVGRDLALALGVPGEVILLEAASRSTIENLKFSAPMLDGHRIILVTSRWHLPRAWVAARIIGLRPRLSGSPGQMNRANTARAIAREAVAIPTTALRALLVRLGLH